MQVKHKNFAIFYQ